MINVIIPMAGQGKRLRPHTLTVPKPLLPIAGKTIVARLAGAIAKLSPTSIAHIGFVVPHLTAELRAQLEAIAHAITAKPRFYEQKEALGTAHAIACAQELLTGKTIIAFADTLFQTDRALDPTQESTIWIKKVKDYSGFGVVKLNPNQVITEFIEKPTSFVSDLAIIGLYYFKEGLWLKEAIQKIIHRIPHVGEFQLTDALRLMQQEGVQFLGQEVNEWLDCGNKNAILHTNKKLLSYLQGKETLVANSAHIHNSILIPPVYVGEQVRVEDSVIGPYVSVGNYTHLKNTCIKNSLIQTHSKIQNINLQNSMLGNYVQIQRKIAELDIGDYNTLEL
jgi:glucose-1-phosphate thymidylyltransferase